MASCDMPETPTITPTNTWTPEPTTAQTPTITPTSTRTFTPTLTFTPHPTSTPVSRCSPRATIQGYPDDSSPGYVDIINVSTSLDTTYLTVMITVREIPDEITINNKNVPTNSLELKLGVAIDIDNNSETGGEAYINGRLDPGYEYVIEAINHKRGLERTGKIQSLFSNQVYIRLLSSNAGYYSQEAGLIGVNQEANTITISGDLEGIKANSYLHFYTFMYDGDKFYLDEVCRR